MILPVRKGSVHLYYIDNQCTNMTTEAFLMAEMKTENHGFVKAKKAQAFNRRAASLLQGTGEAHGRRSAGSHRSVGKALGDHV